MKICPDCQRTYEDNVELCEEDSAALVDAPKTLSDNPELAKVIQVNPDDHTSVIDLEAMEDVLQEHAKERSVKRKNQENLRLRDEDLNDPERTGTSLGSSLSKHEPLPRLDEDESTELTRIPTDPNQKPEDQVDETLAQISANDGPLSARPKIVAKIAVTAIALFGAITIAIFIFTSRASLQIASVPSGAAAFIDGKEIGKTPILKKLRKGAYTVEVVLENHATFKEVVILKSGGSVLTAQLKALDQAEAPEKVVPLEKPKEDESKDLDDEVAEIRRLINQKKFDDAFESIKRLVKEHPNNPRIDALFDELALARNSAKPSPSSSSNASEPLTKEAKRAEAQKLFQIGENAYKNENLDEAKKALRKSLRYRPQYSAPHRVLARIFLAEKNIARVRYHLTRFLKLGGKDPDGAVRRWLEDHPIPS